MRIRFVAFVVLVLVVSLLTFAATRSLAQGPEGGATPQGETAIQAAVGTAFTYQGRLTDNGNPANGTYDFQFKLFDAATGGAQVGSTVTVEDVTVTDGVFTVQLDFGGSAFDGNARWLEIAVRPGSSTGGYTTLAPRQALTPAPYALALPGLWTQQNDTSPNLIGGYSGNSVTDGVVGATIGGGGTADDGSGNPVPNRVTDDYGTVGGGWGNRAGDDAGTTTDARLATVGGGYFNTASGYVATVGGGANNTASGYVATVGGGWINTASGYYATVGGGLGNTASGIYATVGGGVNNIAAGASSFAAGQRAKANHNGTFVWADSQNADFASTGSNQFLIRASGGVGIGTNAPQNQLHVVEFVDAIGTPQNHVAQIENTADSTNADGLAIVIQTSNAPTGANNYITFFKADGPDAGTDPDSVGAIEGNGAGSVVLAGPGSDYAEWLPLRRSTEVLEPGDIVAWTPQGITRNTTQALRLMVVSSNPIVAGNAPPQEERNGWAPVAFVGQVPVKVRGPVQAGDFVLPSGRNDGTGMAVSPSALRADQIGQVVGRALESTSGTGLHTVKVLVGLPQTDILQAMLVQRDAQLAALEARLDALERERGWVRLPGLAPWLGLGLLVGVVLARRWKEVER
nr:hypothetical protein [Ardenticatena sp.]